MIYRDLSHRLLQFSGPDTAVFLQSQLTNDVAALAIGNWQWQGYCTAKGRLLANFALLRTGTEDFVAVVHESTIEPLAKRLTMFRLRSKLTIALMTEQIVALTFDNNVATASTVTLALGDGRAWLLVKTDALTGEINANDAVSTTAANRRWQLAAMAALQSEITSATAEMFVPQMVGWDSVVPGGGVSFSKGCYPGQEIVARAHYRGAVKRHAEHVSALCVDVVVPGSEIILPDGRVAEICNAVQNEAGSWNALVVVAKETLI